jgi:hypothetical protein
MPEEVEKRYGPCENGTGNRWQQSRITYAVDDANDERPERLVVWPFINAPNFPRPFFCKCSDERRNLCTACQQS